MCEGRDVRGNAHMYENVCEYICMCVECVCVEECACMEKCVCMHVCCGGVYICDECVYVHM